MKTLRMVRTAVSDSGRVEPVEGSEFEIPCDMVIKALGQQKQSGLLERLFPKLELSESGTIRCRAENGATNLPHVFGGGDEVNGGAEVVNAVGDGKRAARGIHAFLGGDPGNGPVQTSRYGVENPVGSGLDQPVRVPDLEAAYYAEQGEG